MKKVEDKPIIDETVLNDRQMKVSEYVNKQIITCEGGRNVFTIFV